MSPANEVGPVQPKFPGGMESAPESTAAGGCAHSACSCRVPPGHAYCCRACARASEAAPGCPCGHFGCTDRAF